MIEKDKKLQDLCCNEESCGQFESCDCQGICTCDDFMYEDEESDCDDCCCE